MKTNDSERMQPKGCVKTNEKLTLIQRYWDQAKTKPWYEYHVDQFGNWQGEYKAWYENGQPWVISNFKDGRWHGKFQRWHEDGRMEFDDSNHHKKIRHGTRIEFKYE